MSPVFTTSERGHKADAILQNGPGNQGSITFII